MPATKATATTPAMPLTAYAPTVVDQDDPDVFSELDERVERACADASARALKQSPGRAVYACAEEGVVIKLRRLRLRDRVRAHLFEQEHRGYRALRDAGVPTPAFNLPFVARDAHGTKVHGLALPLLHGPTLIRALADPATPADHIADAAAQLGRIARDIADAGLLHRDCKPSNIVLTPAADVPDRPPRVVLIDPAGVRTRRGIESAADAVARIAYALCVEPIGLGVPVPRAAAHAFLRALTEDPTARAQIRRAAARMLRQNTDKAPKHTPL